MHQMVIALIVAKVQGIATQKFNDVNSKVIFSTNTLIELAKNLGYITSRRGRGGGFEATDKGLEYVRIDVAEFRKKEAMELRQHEEQLKESRKQNREHKQALFQSTLTSAGAMLRLNN